MGEKLKVFPLKSGARTGYPLRLSLFNTVLETLVRATRENRRSLQDVRMQDPSLYLISGYLSMVLKKYLHSIPPGQFMDSKTHKVVTLWYGSLKAVLRPAHYSTPLDIWGIGNISEELATKKPLFHRDSETDQVSRIFRALGTSHNEVWPEVEPLQDYKDTFPTWKPGSLVSHVKHLDENDLDLLFKMLVYYPAKPISGIMVLTHPYFDDLDNQTKRM
ncbi:cyclin-dependent kinase 1-like [Ctenodactylus gundi]